MLRSLVPTLSLCPSYTLPLLLLVVLGPTTNPLRSALSFFILATITLVVCIFAFRILMELPITKV